MCIGGGSIYSKEKVGPGRHLLIITVVKNGIAEQE